MDTDPGSVQEFSFSAGLGAEETADRRLLPAGVLGIPVIPDPTGTGTAEEGSADLAEANPEEDLAAVIPEEDSEGGTPEAAEEAATDRFDTFSYITGVFLWYPYQSADCHIPLV